MKNTLKQMLLILLTDLLLDNKSGAREETNAQYWILKG